jgi:hypothetical protein
MGAREAKAFDVKVARRPFDSLRSLRAFDMKMARRPFDSLRSLRAFDMSLARHERTWRFAVRRTVR